MRSFAAFNKLKITNKFFTKKGIHKYIWSTRTQKSIIDYIITNNKLAGQVNETSVYR